MSILRSRGILESDKSDTRSSELTAIGYNSTSTYRALPCRLYLFTFESILS